MAGAFQRSLNGAVPISFSRAGDWRRLKHRRTDFNGQDNCIFLRLEALDGRMSVRWRLSAQMRLAATYSLIELLLCFIILVVFIPRPILLCIRYCALTLCKIRLVSSPFKMIKK